MQVQSRAPESTTHRNKEKRRFVDEHKKFFRQMKVYVFNRMGNANNKCTKWFSDGLMVNDSC